MKAIVQRRYGSPDRLALEEIDTPPLEDDRVLVRTRAASVNAYDWHMMRGQPYFRLMSGLRRPGQPIAGIDLAGIVEAVGARVTKFRPGDEVFGAANGAFAEYACGRERNLTLKPAAMTFEQAAAVPMAGTTALQALRDTGRIQAGQRVLVNGAAGGVGTFAVQLAKAFGADVTGVCGTAHVDVVRSIGADRVIDYTREDFTRGGERYDLLLDIAGNRSLWAYRRIMEPHGTLVMVGGRPGRWLGGLDGMLMAKALSRLVSRRMLGFLARHSDADRVVLKELIEAGRVTPVIDRTYSLAETAQAIRYLEEGHAGGKVVITV